VISGMPHKNTAKELIIILGVSLSTAFLVNLIHPKGIALFGQWDSSQGVITAKSKDEVINHDLEIRDIVEAKEIYDRGVALFVDARTKDDYDDGHIKGAISLPVGQFDLLIDEFLENYPADTAIVTYCSGKECDDSHKLAQFLLEMGYTTVRVFIDGYPGWVSEGYPNE
jgi:rhodanese-related sulfurtransferase